MNEYFCLVACLISIFFCYKIVVIKITDTCLMNYPKS